MSVGDCSSGPLEAAVKGYHPSQSVLFEARSLDRELLRAEPSWDPLLYAIGSFVAHYASVLLHEPTSIDAIGQACLRAVRSAPAVAQRVQAATLLAALLVAVAEEVEREGIGRVAGEVPERLCGLVRKLAAEQDLPFDRGLLVLPVLALGRQVVMMADEGAPPQLWFDLLGEINGLLLSITRRRVSGEPFYDGRWDREPESSQLATEHLQAVRAERIGADLSWLDALQADVQAGKRTSPEVFLELSTYEKRDEREQVWQAWFDRVAARVAAGAVEPGVLRKLGEGLAEWIADVEDRSFLVALASALKRTLPTALEHADGQVLDTALATFGQAIVERLERESGRGEEHPALTELAAAACGLIERKVSASGELSGDVFQLLSRLRTGPTTGQPFGCEDVLWRLRISLRLAPEQARGVLLGLVAGFALEEIRLVPWRTNAWQTAVSAGQSRRLVDALASLLGRTWPRAVVPVVRMLLRLAPLSPLELAGARSRSTLMALAHAESRASFLVDLKDRILGRPGPDNIGDVERVLGFLLDGRVERLDGLVSPDSLAALTASETRDAQIRRLLTNLTECAPVSDKEGVRWLARLPEAYYDPDNLVKLAGFEGLTAEAPTVLGHLLVVYRELTNRYRPIDIPSLAALDEAQLLRRADTQLEKRQRAATELFHPDALEGLGSFERLERFRLELDLALELDATMEELAVRTDRADAFEPLARMLAHAELSGAALGESGQPSDGRFTERNRAEVIERLAERLACYRQQLARQLRPYVLDSLRRLRANPLARPAAAYRSWFVTRRHVAEEEATDELLALLVDDLLCADGGVLRLEALVQRLGRKTGPERGARRSGDAG